MIEFADFLRIAHGGDLTPYPWQARLAERCAEGEPPSAIAVPTGSGKTMTIDALIWALAQQADRPAAQRTVGVRIVWAIDRRILVDEVHEHVASLATTLEQALSDQHDPLYDMAVRLAVLSGDGETPLVATRWRGGLEGRPDRCGPLQPQVITSTIAQIGSRLLFRGYGVGRRSLAIEAGLAACDTTICLDEAHLVEPFRETVESIRAHRRASEREVELPGLRTITLTATPPRETIDTLTLGEHDRAALGARFVGEKRARLLAGEGEAAQVKLLAARSVDYVRAGAATVACVVNTVQRARMVFDVLKKELVDEVDVALLIGPQRPADRDRILERHRRQLFDGVPGERPLICVATQTFEVGLDADVAAMVTESASATALVQRLGRLNRRGLVAGQATIVRDEGRWLYADDEPVAWTWLEGLAGDDGGIDVSVAALAHDPPPPSRPPCAATLTTEVVELLAQTSPRPGGWREPDPEVFLRGPDAKATAEVAVCWRCDLRADLLGAELDEYRATLLTLVPPQRQELLTLSLTAARALLAARYPRHGISARAARAALLDADVEDAMSEDNDWPEQRRDDRLLPFVLLRGDEVHRGTLNPAASDESTVVGSEADAIGPSALRPGDVLVLPTDAGGVDGDGLAPAQPRGQH
ncbi:MAG: type I-G CRISPR-associated helicase/endonuclease Cas3g, partial [Solirubrobacteraceae bacterium]